MSPTHRHAAGHSNLGSAVERQGREAPGQCWGVCGKDRGEESSLLNWYLTWAHHGASMRRRILSSKPWASVTELQEGTHGARPGRTTDPETRAAWPTERTAGCGTGHPARQKHPCSLQDASKAPHLTALHVRCP